MKWCVAQVQSNRDHWAIKNLNAQGFETFHPLLRERRGKELVLKPMFPGYIFVAVDEKVQRWKAINSTFGVFRLIVSSPESPSFVPQPWIQSLMSLGGIVDKFEEVLTFTEGDLVEFTDGPFLGKVGKYQFSGSKRVAVLLSLLGREVTVYSKYSSLKLASQPREFSPVLR